MVDVPPLAGPLNLTTEIESDVFEGGYALYECFEVTVPSCAEIFGAQVVGCGEGCEICKREFAEMGA